MAGLVSGPVEFVLKNHHLAKYELEAGMHQKEGLCFGYSPVKAFSFATDAGLGLHECTVPSLVRMVATAVTGVMSTACSCAQLSAALSRTMLGCCAGAVCKLQVSLSQGKPPGGKNHPENYWR